jgi:hypothetical protein
MASGLDSSRISLEMSLEMSRKPIHFPFRFRLGVMTTLAVKRLPSRRTRVTVPSHLPRARAAWRIVWGSPAAMASGVWRRSALALPTISSDS